MKLFKTTHAPKRAHAFRDPMVYTGHYPEVRREVPITKEIPLVTTYLVNQKGKLYGKISGFFVELYNKLTNGVSYYEEVPYIKSNGEVQTITVPVIDEKTGQPMTEMKVVPDYSVWTIGCPTAIKSKEELTSVIKDSWDKKFNHDKTNMSEEEFFDYYGAPKGSDVIERIIEGYYQSELAEALKLCKTLPDQ